MRELSGEDLFATREMASVLEQADERAECLISSDRQHALVAELEFIELCLQHIDRFLAALIALERERVAMGDVQRIERLACRFTEPQPA